MLVDRWMLQKMQDAEKLNEANAMYQDMLDRLKASGVVQLARQEVDGVVRQGEAGAEYFSEFPIPSCCHHIIHAHDGGCGSVLFKYNSSELITGGQDQIVKVWDTNGGKLVFNLHGSIGSILDLTVTHDNRSVIGASSSNNLYVWDMDTGRIRHILTGHSNKVCAVDASKVSARSAVSSGYDRTMKVWDLQRGYCINTLISHSNCNALCFGIDGQIICTGHVDGNLRLWDARTSKLVNEVSAHSNAITSVCLSQTGSFLLTSGRDNLHNLFDMRTLEICYTTRANGSKVATNWSRSCISPDENHIVAGSTDGSVCIWSRSAGNNSPSSLKGDGAPVLACAWSGLGKSLAFADKNGIVYIWK